MDAGTGSSGSSFAYRAIAGSAGGTSRVATLGNNPDVDTTSTPEDVWAGAALGMLNGIDHKLVQLPQAALAMELVSDNANDTAAGTGMRTVSVTYLDSARTSKTITLTLNGTTPVALPENVLRVNLFRGLTSGTFGGANIGNLSIRAVGGLGATYAYMQAGTGFARSSLFSVPAGVTLDILGLIFAVNRTDANDRWAVLSLCLQNQSGCLSKALVLPVSTYGNYRHEAPGGVPLTSAAAGTDAWVRCDGVSASNTDLTCGFVGFTRTGAAN